MLVAVVLLAGCQLNSPAVTEEVNLSPAPTVTDEAELPLPASPPSVPSSLPLGEPIVTDDATFEDGDNGDEQMVVSSPDAPEASVVYCTADAQACPDGTFVERDPQNNCEFKPCPGM